MQNNPTRKLFVAVEGPDCAGKTTLIRGLVSKFLDSGIPCIPASNPGGTHLGSKIKEGIVTAAAPASLDAQLLGFCAAHCELVEKVLMPNQANSVVIFDRYLLSTIIYQGLGNKLYLRSFLNRVHDLVGHLPHPDVYIVLQATGEALKARHDARKQQQGVVSDGSNPVEPAEPNQMEKDGSLAVFNQMALDWSNPWPFSPVRNIMTVDVSRRSEEEVLQHVWGQLTQRFGDPTAPRNNALDAARAAAAAF